MTEDIAIDDISHFLLNNKYHLTALEFDFELIERGTENKILRNFFTNPMNFDGVSSHNELSNSRLKNSPSVSTIDSIDFSKYSDDGLQLSDERIKVLEFELRKKTEEVRKLREELTQMSAATVHTSFVLEWMPSEIEEAHSKHSMNSLLAHENRTLNFLINEYLLQHRFKLTAVSFSEEVTDQDLDSWDDVGLNISKLPSLEYLLKTKLSTLEDFLHKSTQKSLVTYEDGEVQTDPMDNGQLEHYISLSDQLRDTVKSLEQECDYLTQAQIRDAAEIKTQTQLMTQQKRELNETKSKLICAQRDLVQESFKKKVSNQAPNSTSGDTDMKSETVSDISNVMDEVGNLDRMKCSSNTDEHLDDLNDNKDEHQESGFSDSVPLRTTTKQFVKMLQLRQDCDNDNNSTSMPLVGSLDEFVYLTSEALPRLFQIVAAKDDPDLMMILIQSTCLHPDTRQREKLLKFLINLYPEPNDSQRNLVLKQIETLAGYLGPFRVEAELITQIWEMLYEKPKLNSSKRILLAYICGIICPLAPTNLRSSLILSIHQQMLEEENDQKVVPHILTSIASTIPYLEDMDKIPIIVQLTSKYLFKSSQSSDYHRTESNSEPTAADVVEAKLLPAVAQWCLDANVIHLSLVREILASMTNQSTINQTTDYQSTNRHLSILHLLLPFLEIWIKGSAPNISDEVDEDLNCEPNSPVNRLEEPSLYSCTVIVTPHKYRQIQHRFIRYTAISIPQNLIETAGDDCSDTAAVMSCWSAWPQLRWLQTELVDRLVLLLKDFAPKYQHLNLSDTKVISDLAKSQFTYSPMRSREPCTRASRFIFVLCNSLSTSVVNDVIQPLITSHLYGSSSKGVDCDLKPEVVVTGLVSGQCAVLASLASLNPSTIAYDNLRRFLTNIFFLISAENLSCDGIKHSISTLCSCLGVGAVTDVVLPAMQPCVSCSDISVQMLMCIVVLELVSNVTDKATVDINILQPIINFLQQLIVSPHESVRVLTIGPLVTILQIPSLPDTIKAQVFASLTDLMKESVNFTPEITDSIIQGPSRPGSEIIITALIQMINIVGSSSPESFRDEAILPWLLGITEINNSTSDIARRSAIAMILYSTFSTLSYYLESSNVLETCLLPSLDRLRLDMAEIYPENVKEVESMSQEIRKRLDVRQRHGTSDSLSSVKGKIAGLSFMSRTATATSSATSSLFGKIRDIKDSSNGPKSDDQVSTSSSSSTTKSNITNFFTKKR